MTVGFHPLADQELTDAGTLGPNAPRLALP